MNLAIRTEQLRSNLEALIGEMSHLLISSAYSTLLRESRDCSFLFLGPDGDVVVLPDDSFLHGPGYRWFARAVVEDFGDDMEPGDVYVTNHPYDGGVPHVPDLAILVPVYLDGSRVGFSASIAHKADMGGSVPGSSSSSATDLHQEGVLVPLTRLRAGQVADDWAALTAILGANVREPATVLGDARAQLGVTQLGGERAAEIVARYGVRAAIDAMNLLLDGASESMRREVTSWEDGRATASAQMDSDGVRLDEPIDIKVAVEVLGGAVTIDFTGTAPEQSGPVNIPQAYAEAACLYALGAVLPLTTPFNDGLRRHLTLVLPEGSMVNPRYPRPVGAATITKYRLVDVLLEALGQMLPVGGVANSGGSGGAMMIAYQMPRAQEAGASTLQYEIFGTGFGASSTDDGESGVTVFGTNLSVTPIEVLELQYPVRVRRFELIPDSGGPGRYRGGLSYRREYELLVGATVVRRADRVRYPPCGVAGGHQGRAGAFLVQRPGEDPHPTSGVGSFELPAGSIITVEGAGGGGFGQPHDRPPPEVADDLARGYVSQEAATSIYGSHEGKTINGPAAGHDERDVHGG